MYQLKRRAPTISYRLAAAFTVFLLLTTTLVWQALHYPMVYDDLHLIRSFSTQQIASAFHAAYDPDSFENAGLRPCMVLYNGARYLLFGENVVAHRLFLVTTYALYWTLICWIAAAFKLGWFWSILAGLLSISSKYNVSHYVWLTDGIHIFQGLTFSVALICLLKAIDTRRWWLLALSVAVMLIGLLTREDTLAVVPVVVILGYVYTKQRGDRSLLPLVGYTLLLGALCVAFLIFRATVVPKSPVPSTYLVGMVFHIILTPNLLGLTHFNTTSTILIDGWFAIALLLLFSKLVFRAVLPRSMPVIWLGCTILACLPGLNVDRANLLFFPTTFIALFFASVLEELVHLYPRFRLLAILMLCWGILGGIYMSSVTMQSFHPFSQKAVVWNSDFIYGKYALRSTIPPARSAMIRQQLSLLGINEAADLSTQLPRLVAEAESQHRVTPQAANLLFIPRLVPIEEKPFPHRLTPPLLSILLLLLAAFIYGLPRRTYIVF